MPPTSSTPTVGIGAISKATGIPSETLRTWERRYGFPTPQRTRGGHRKYDLGVIEHLKLIQQALDQGFRPSHIMGEPAPTLRVLLGLRQQDERTTGALRSPAPRSDEGAGLLGAPCVDSSRHTARLDALMDATLQTDAERMNLCLERAWREIDAIVLLEQVIAPFLRRVGQAWHDGAIAVLHEQFASQHLGRFLKARWRPLSARASGPALFCATLSGEYHVLGLHMVATAAAVIGCRVAAMEQSVSPAHIAQRAKACHAHHVLVSVSAAAHPTRVERQAVDLVRQLPEGVGVLLGDAGAPEVEGAMSMRSLEGLEGWIADRSPPTPPRPP